MVCSASADCTVRLFDALEGHLTYIFHGHASAVVSVAYSPTGRYIVSSSDYGERAIKLWDAAMPATASVTPVTMRVQWTTEGLISRFTLVKDPPRSLLEPPKKDQQDNHLGEKRQDPWDLLTDGEDEESEQERRAREKEERKKARDAERELRDASIQAAPDIKESGGFSLSLASVDRFGRVTQVDSYYGGVTLQVILRGVDPIAEFFVGGYGKDSVHDTFVKGSGARRGLFGRDLPLGTRHTCDKAAVNTRRFNARPEEGEEPERHTLSYTLTEVDPPKKGSVLSDLGQQSAAGGEQAAVFNFTAAVLHQLFIELIRNRDIAEASNMLSPVARLKVREGLKKGAPTELHKGKDAVMVQVEKWMANGVSVIKDARDLAPGKSMTVLLHGEPLAPPEPPSGEVLAVVDGDAEPPAKELRKAAGRELDTIRDLRAAKLQCAEEVRGMWAPSGGPAELPKPAEASQSMITDGRYGGNMPHLQMSLPFNYPINAKGFGTDLAARKGLEAMDSGGKGKSRTKQKRDKSSAGDRKAQVDALARLAERRDLADREEAANRRDAHQGQGEAAPAAAQLVPDAGPRGQARPSSTRREERRLATAARVAGGELRTFWASDGDFHAHHHTVNQVAWSVDEKRVASCSNDKTVRLWAPQTGQCVRTLAGHEDAVMGNAFSEDGLRLVSCGMDNFLILWNTVNGEMLRRFFGHDDVVYRCVLFRNSSAMLSCSSDRTLKSWFLTPQPPDPPERCAVADAGRRAASLAWRAPPAYNDEIVAYKIQWRVGLREAFGHESTVDGSTFKRTVGGLTPGQNYQFRICAVNRMGQGRWSEPSAQHVTKKFRVQCAGEGADFAGKPQFERFVTWKEGRTLALEVEHLLSSQIREDANIWRRSGPATKGKTFEVPESALVKFTEAARALDDEELAPEEKERKTRKIEKKRRATIKALAADEQKRQEDARFAKLAKGILMAAAFDGLRPGFDYRVRASAVSSVGEGPFSDPTYNARTPPDLPGDPATPTVEALSNEAVKVSWFAPGKRRGDHAEVERDDGGEVLEFDRAQCDAIYDGLRAGRRYTFRFRAFNHVGASNWSAWAAPVSTLTSLPEAPERPVVTEATIIAVGLRVVKPNNGGKIISKLVVQRRELRPGGVKSEWANELGFPPAPGATGTPCDLTIEPLKPSVVYQFRVAAANANGTSGWSLPSFRSKTQDAEPPTKPGDPEVAKCYPKAADLTWAPADPRGSPVAGHVLELKRLRRAPPGAAGDDEVGRERQRQRRVHRQRRGARALVREVTRETAGAADGIVTTLEIGYRSTYHAENLEPTARYVFRVAACNGEGQGPWSAWSDSFATLQPAQPAPTAPRATQRRTNARGRPPARDYGRRPAGGLWSGVTWNPLVRARAARRRAGRRSRGARGRGEAVDGLDFLSPG
ncbi:myosin light chain kinase [Aureococcus anophagefferens]|nr:myosin light chain kinase [Aureococcus anophagefferens]